MNPTVERALWASTPALRCLAPLDAILAPALGLYWIKTLPASGGLVGAVLGVFCLWIGAKRAYRALFEFEAYRWMTLRLAKLAIATWVVMALFNAYFSPSWTAFQADRGRDFSVIVDGVSV